MFHIRVAILGGGPMGLEAALYARALGYTVTLYERGEIGTNIHEWGFLPFFTPWHANVTRLGLDALERMGRALPTMDACPPADEFRERYLNVLAGSPQLAGCIRQHCRVASIKHLPVRGGATGLQKRGPFELLLVDPFGHESREQADVILDCTGTYGNHRWAGRGGLPAIGERDLASRIFYKVPDVLGKDRERFADRHTLILGCGYSAATVLFQLERLNRMFPETKVSWAIRRPGQAMQALNDDPLPGRRRLVQASLRLSREPPAWMQFLGNCVMEQVASESRRLAITLNCDGVALAMVVDELAAMVGYLPDDAITQALHVPSVSPRQSDAEPGYFVLGAKSYGTNSNFTLAIGHRQILDAFAKIAGPAFRDCYQLKPLVQSV